jgi:hypothetical protein
MNVAELLRQARQEPKVVGLAPEAARGAEAYFQAYQYITAGGQARTKWRRRRLATRYLAITASPPLAVPELKAAQIAEAVIKRLS